MELLRVSQVGTRLHIDGFPGIKVIQLNGPKARRLSDLALYRVDLQFAKDSLEALNNNALSDHIRESLWRSAIVHFFKCFGANESRFSLPPESVYKGAPPEVMMVFDHFKLIRNKHLVHDENSYSQCSPRAILNDGTKSFKVEKVVSAVALANTLDETQYLNFQLSIQRALDWVVGQLDVLCEHLARELEAMTYSDLCAMPDVTITAPKLEDLGHPRKCP